MRHAGPGRDKAARHRRKIKRCVRAMAEIFSNMKEEGEMKKKNLTRTLSAVMAAAMVMTATLPVFADVSGESKSTSTTKDIENDLANADVINLDNKGSITIHKYDITSATQDGVYNEGDVRATGSVDTALEDTLADYAIEGVEFTYLRVGDIEQYSITTGTGTQLNLVYEIPGELAAILGLADEDGYQISLTGNRDSTISGYSVSKTVQLDDSLKATDMDAEGIAADNQCTESGVYHYTSDQINEALEDLIEDDYVYTKDILEAYMAYEDDAVALELTDKSGTTTTGNIDLGLYLIVETAVPENVVDTVNPFFVSVPMTNMTADDGHEYDDDNDGGSYWFYDIDVYPKNQTGNPTLDKMVRNATGTPSTYTSKDQDAHNTTTDNSNKLLQGTEGLDYIVSNYTDDYGAYGSVIDYDNDGDVDADDFVNGLRGVYGTLAAASQSAQGFAEQRGLGTYSTTNNGVNALAGSTDTDTDNANDGETTDQEVSKSESYSGEYQYASTTTASSGDVLDYILVSKIPHISSTATFLTQYQFDDILSEGLTYNEDVRIAFYTSAADAYINNTENAVDIWEADYANHTNANSTATQYFTVVSEGTDYGETKLTVSFTDAGLAYINGDNELTDGAVDPTKGYSDYYMVVYYTATVNLDKDGEVMETLVLGDQGNENDVTLTWSRTSTAYYDTLEDKCIVYSYGIDLTKEFTGTDGNFKDVEFNLYNRTDGYYVVAEKQDDSGIYWVTGKSADQSGATVFVPDETTGKIYIYGLEGDVYGLTELSTTDGYSLLADEIEIDIATASESIQAAVAGWTGQNYDITSIERDDDNNVSVITFTYDGVSYDWEKSTGKYYLAGTATEVTDADVLQTLGNNISGKIDMIEGNFVEGAATVDGVLATMLSTDYTYYDVDAADDGQLKYHTYTGTSENAIVALTITNTKNFTLPLTGGAGLYLITILGVIAVAGGCWIAFGRKKENNNVMAA